MSRKPTPCDDCGELGWGLVFVPELNKFLCPDCIAELPQECPECGDTRPAHSYGRCKKCGYHG